MYVTNKADDGCWAEAGYQGRATQGLNLGKCIIKFSLILEILASADF